MSRCRQGAARSNWQLGFEASETFLRLPLEQKIMIATINNITHAVFVSTDHPHLIPNLYSRTHHRNNDSTGKSLLRSVTVGPPPKDFARIPATMKSWTCSNL